MCCELQNSNNKIVGFTVADYTSIKFTQNRSIKKDISGESTLDYFIQANKIRKIHSAAQCQNIFIAQLSMR